MILFGSFLIRGDRMAGGLPIRSDIGPDVLRGLARRENNGRAASRMFAIANALEGMERAEAARIEVWFQDEARVGQKGRAGHRWFARGQRPPGLCDKRFDSTYLFGAVRAGSDDAFALVLPEATTETMNLFLAGFAHQLAPEV